MTDSDFWEEVFNGPAYGDDDWETTEADLIPCPECGETGPCAYDNEGRALIHVITQTPGK